MRRLKDYISDVRIKIDDDPIMTNPTFSDIQLTKYINNARRKIAGDLRMFENQYYLTPTLYIDEYTLPNDFLEATLLEDTWNQFQITAMNKGNIESTKVYYDVRVQFGQFCYINETRRKLTLLKAFINVPDIQPLYNISAFDRSANTIVVDGVQAGYTLGDIMMWETKAKGFIKIKSATGVTEYSRVSKILANTPTTGKYTLYISSWDLQGTYKDALEATGTVSYSTNIITGIATTFLSEVSSGDSITVNSQTQVVNTVFSNVNCNVTNAFTGTASSKTMTISNLPVFADNDTIQFIMYVLNYSSIPFELTYQNQYDKFPVETEVLVPILAAQEAMMACSLGAKASEYLAEYNSKVKDIGDKLGKGKANILNEQSSSMNDYGTSVIRYTR
jgi:hypothetical protein